MFLTVKDDLKLLILLPPACPPHFLDPLLCPLLRDLFTRNNLAEGSLTLESTAPQRNTYLEGRFCFQGPRMTPLFSSAADCQGLKCSLLKLECSLHMWPPPSVFLELCLQERTTSKGLCRSSVLHRHLLVGDLGPRARVCVLLAPSEAVESSSSRQWHLDTVALAGRGRRWVSG